jgi:hypothetical protein
MAVEILRNPCKPVTGVINQAMGARFEVKPVFEMVTQLAGDMTVRCCLA